MYAAFLISMAFLPAQDFKTAQAAYAEVEVGPAEAAKDLAERVRFTRERVAALEARLASEREKLAELDTLEVERYLALKSHFDGEVLESRLQRETQQLDLRRKGFESSIAMTAVDLEDARARSEQLEIDLRLARIEDGLVRRADAEPGTPVTDRLEERSAAILWERGLAAGRFELRPVPISWVTRND